MTSKRFFSRLGLGAMALLLSVSVACAAPAAKSTPAPPKHTVISTVSAESITVDTGSGSKTYKITKNTEITFGGKNVKVDELKAGMRVSVVAGFDTSTAGEIAASNAPKATPSPSGSKKK